MLPHEEVLAVLERAYDPCPGFGGACKGMRWAPDKGHVPRGFAGASGPPENVELALVAAEPGDPHDVETYPSSGSARDTLSAVCRYVYGALQAGTDQYHRNVRYI